jgi:hypothetical protein
MTYICDPVVGGGVVPSANIPINNVPPHVLMTTEVSYYAGPGDKMEADKYA